MDDADALSVDARLADVRQVDAVGDIAVDQIIAQLGSRHNRAVGFTFGGAGAQMRRAGNPLDTQQLLAGEIAEILCDLAAVQGIQQSGVVHQLTAGKVQHAHALLAHGKRLSIDGMAGRGQVGDMDGQVIAAGQHIAQRDAVLHTARQAPCGINGDIRVVPQYLHAQRHSRIRNARADGSQADHAQRLATQLGTDKLLFALFHILGNGVAPFQRLRPVHGIHHITAACHQRTDDQLCHRVGIGTGRVEHHNALGSAGIHRDVVGSRTCAGDRQKAVGHRHIVHIGAAHQNAVRCAGIVVDLKLVGGQLAQPGRGDGVQRFDGIHKVAPSYLCSLRNFSIKSTSLATPSGGIAL